MAQPNEVKLEWIQMKKDFSEDQVETAREKFMRKFKQNPLVPVGCLATAGALSFGLYSFRRGERRMSQIMMRTRIVAQGFTVAALIIGVMITMSQTNENKKSS